MTIPATGSAEGVPELVMENPKGTALPLADT